MKETEIIEFMSDIDDEYIDEVRERERCGGRKRRTWLRTAAIAACAALVLGGAFAVWRGLSRPGAPETPTTPGVTDPAGVFDPDFMIYNGALVKYLGTDTTVTVPRGVSTIAAGAFRTSSSSSSITEIRLSEDVKDISEEAFAGLGALERIDVPPGNDAFTFGEGVLSAANGSIHFSLDKDDRIDVAQFLETLEKMGRIKEYTERDITFVFGDVVLVARSEALPEPDPDSVEQRSAWYAVRSVSAFGRTFEVERGKYFDKGTLADGVIEVNALFELFRADGAVVYEKRVSDFGLAVVITPSGVTEIYNSTDAPCNEAAATPTWYNDPIVWFGVDEDGRLTYTRTPRKYAFDQSLDLELRYCTGRDEFAREEGIVTFDGAKIAYVPERTYTAGEVFDLDDLFADWRRNLGSFDEELKEYATLDELISYNRELYEAAR